MTACIILRRVSTDSQAESGLGLEAQSDACRTFAAKQGWTVMAERTETCSGGADLAARPVLLDALADLAELGRGAVLLVSSWCRLSRSVLTTELVLERCRSTGARVASADGSANESTPEADLMRRIIGACSAYERARIAVRTRLALRAKKARGEPMGARPLGQNASESGTLAACYSLDDAGRTPAQIAGELTRLGHTGRRGSPITHSTVRRWLARRSK